MREAFFAAARHHSCGGAIEIIVEDSLLGKAKEICDSIVSAVS